MAYCPFRNPDVFVTGHRSPKVVSWAAIKVDIKTNRPRFWASWFYPQSAGGICAAGNLYLKVPESWFIPADALQGMVLGYLSHILADMLTPAGVPLLWPCRWRFRLPITVPQRATNWNVLSAWHYLSGRYGCPIHYFRKQRCPLVIANDQYLADPVSSAY